MLPFRPRKLRGGSKRSAKVGRRRRNGSIERHGERRKRTDFVSGHRLVRWRHGAQICSNSTWKIISFVSAIFLKSFTLTFLAEWGDRSQLTTIILAARENISGVIIGGVLGHAICTSIAVIFGRLLAQQISVRTGWCLRARARARAVASKADSKFLVTLIGGVVFILFALSALFIDRFDA